MRGLQRSSRRFLFQNILLFILTGTFAFLGVYFTGRSAYRSANELGAMTADYLNLQVNSFMSQYQQILEDYKDTEAAKDAQEALDAQKTKKTEGEDGQDAGDGSQGET